MVEQGQTQTWTTAARQGDSLALAKLLATVHPQLQARAEARMDAALRAKVGPDDILQEVYLQIFRHIDEFEDHGPNSFVNWAFTILDHELVDARRAAYRRVRDLAREVPPRVGEATNDSYCNLLDLVYADSSTPSRIVRREEAVSALQACLAALSEAQRTVVELRFLSGLPLSEVAARMDKTEGAVVALTQRALAALRSAMEHRGDFTRGG